MLLYPKDIKEKLEFNKITEAIKTECLSEMAGVYFDHISLQTEKFEIERLLNETEEYRKSLERNEYIPLSGFESLTEDIALLRKEGYVLEIESIRKIYLIVSIGGAIRDFFTDPEKVKLNPLIAELCSAIIIDPALNREIDRVLDEQGKSDRMRRKHC
jgi:DNA mismatch repair protein MutS2